MNKTSRTDEPFEGEGYNQNPNPLSNDLITNEGLNGIVNSRELKREEPQSLHGITQQADRDKTSSIAPEMRRGDAFNLLAKRWIGQLSRGGDKSPLSDTATITPGDGSTGSCDQGNGPQSLIERFKNGLLKFCSFIGPGFMVSVAYSMESFHSQIRYFSELTLSLL